MVNTKRKRGGVFGTSQSPIDKLVLDNVTLYRTLKQYLDGDSSIPNINEWDVSGVTRMKGLFYRRKEFNEDISRWDVSNVTNTTDMFAEDSLIQYEYLPVRFRPLKSTNETIRSFVREYLQNPKSYIPINQWNVSRVTNMSSLFERTTFNEDIRDWKVYNVTDMSLMFAGCEHFNQDIGIWNVGSVTNMNSMFAGCHQLNVDLSIWNTQNVVDMKRMFLETNMPGHFKPHLHFLSRSDGFDIILVVVMHGQTITSCPTNHEPNFANATLLEATPCGITNFCNQHSEPRSVIGYIHKNKNNPNFVTDLQKYLRTFKQQKIENAQHDVLSEEDKVNYQWYIREQGWQIITHGYMDRLYVPDSESWKLQRISVCHSKPKGAFDMFDILNESYRINSRTDLMHLLKDSGYGKPLIIDFSCGSYEDDLADVERQRRIDLGRRIKVAGMRQKKRTLKKRVY